ncbi:MAG: GNAT family N-acetyltransferase [Bacteroidota bacterium]|nr:GNAT family N-acetyltransferase [Bacteroidota bacterium]
MNRKYNEAKVFDRQNKQYIDSKLYFGISSKNIDDYEQLWIPMFYSEKKEVQDRLTVEDAHWNWRKKVLLCEGILAYGTYALEADNKTQGMMITETVMHQSKLQSTESLIYIEFIASAPWNRSYLVPHPKYKGVGMVLLSQAIGESFENGYEGRIGLHSLPGAETFYKNLGMIDCGFDNHKQLNYFELPIDKASELIKEFST